MSDTHSKIGIFILCYNVEKSISKVLLTIPPAVYEAADVIIMIDNQSSDRTIEAAKEAISEKHLTKIKILKNIRNFGYGGSHKVAFDYLISKKMDYAVLLHGDGQGDQEVLAQLINCARESAYDFVIGSRFLNPDKLDPKYSRLRVLANYFFVGLQRVLTGQNITDPGSGEMAYSLKFLKTVPYHQLTDAFHFTPQLLLYCSRRPIKFKEFPLRWGESETSSVNIWKHGWNLLKMLVAYRIKGVPLAPHQTADLYPTQVVFEIA